MRVLNVTLTKTEPQFDTFQEAIDSMRNTPRELQGERDTISLKGVLIEGFAFSDDRVTLYLSDRRWLTYHLADGMTVNWTVGQGHSPMAPNEHEGDPELLLDWGNGQPYLWKRLELLQRLVNKPIVMIGASHTWAFLTVGGGFALRFAANALTDGSGDILVYFEQ